MQPIEGFPLKSHKKLLKYLKTHSDSFQLRTYAFRKRSNEGSELSINNNINTTQPRFCSNEDIMFAKFDKSKFQIYQHRIFVNFSVINKAKANQIKFSKDETYFAIGYPGRPHYDMRDLKNEDYYPLIDDIGLSPLFVISSTCHKGEKIEKNRPYFNNGKIMHEAPTTRGMSGGPLIKITSGDGSRNIKVFGRLTSNNDDMEIGCY